MLYSFRIRRLLQFALLFSIPASSSLSLSNQPRTNISIFERSSRLQPRSTVAHRRRYQLQQQQLHQTHRNIIISSSPAAASTVVIYVVIISCSSSNTSRRQLICSFFEFASITHI